MSSQRLSAVLRFAIAEFSPLLGFFILSWSFGLKAAIGGVIVITLTDLGWRLYKRIEITRTFVFFTGLTMVFGVIDLLSSQPFVLKYEAVLSNIVTGFVFVAGANWPKPLIQTIAEQREDLSFNDTAEVRAFFRIFTLVWAGYFFLKAAFYFYVAWIFPMGHALSVRAFVGSISFGLMLALSVTQGRRFFLLCRSLGILPTRQAEAQTEAGQK